MRLLLVLLLTGCTFDPTTSLDPLAANDGPHHITNYVAKPLHPLNCGTPYDFRICPLPVRAPIKSEPLPFTRIIIEEISLDGVTSDTAQNTEDEARIWVEK